KFMNMRFEPAGMTDDEEIRFATSIIDYLARKLAIEYLPADRRADLGIYTSDERTAALDAQYGGGSTGVSAAAPVAPTTRAEALPAAPAADSPATYDADAPLCYSCGTPMVRAGSCHLCEQCGATSGCS
ncbi:MAG: vitamin B12-dependent ribonucleotide reductase, partial [Actinomycetota bacterium]|nr:vitamin B12-dependent ribonucleotide reductase [Actinomycetota bacterium]